MSTSTQVSHPLTLVMNIKSENDFFALMKLLAGFAGMPPGENPIDNALNKIGTVHFARFVFLSSTQLSVITSYDGSFDDYILAFVNEIGEIFNELLSHMSDAPTLPVQNNLKEFAEYVKANDRSEIGGIIQPLYSAYPTLSVKKILELAGS